MLPIEIDTPTWWREHFNNEENETKFKFKRLGENKKESRRYNTRVMQSEIKEGDLVLKQVVAPPGSTSYSLTWKALTEYEKGCVEVITRLNV